MSGGEISRVMLEVPAPVSEIELMRALDAVLAHALNCPAISNVSHAEAARAVSWLNAKYGGAA